MGKLVGCKTCGRNVDKSAKICPNCGVSNPGVNSDAMKGCLVLVLLVFIVGGFIGFNSEVSEDKKPKTPAEQRAEDIRKQFSPFDGSHYQLTKLIEASMKNPDSFDHVKTVYIDKGDYLIVETQYRGTNSFGAVVPGVIQAKVALNGDVLEILK
jgi:hypothetical protein